MIDLCKLKKLKRWFSEELSREYSIEELTELIFLFLDNYKI
jgi:hypothetical protein